MNSNIIMKNLIKLFSIILLLFISVLSCNAESVIWTENNILTEALAKKKETLLELVWWWKLENEINNLKIELWKIEVWRELNQGTKEKIAEEIKKLEDELAELKKWLIENINAKEFDELIKKYNEEIALKKDLVEELNKEIKENDINYEKIDLLIEKYVQEKQKMDESKNIQKIRNLLAFLIVTAITLAIYTVSTHFSKTKKLSTKKYVYVNFFLAFAYILFLIIFFFYLYPEFSVFLIFMSWYMLIINSHLIGSFIWSIIVLQKFKIWEIIKSWTIYWRITNITPLYIVLTPMTADWVYISESVFIPHINILKESITKNNIPDLLNHTFKVVIKEDSGIDVVKFLDYVEKNILQKLIHNKLRSISWNQDYYRISFDFTNIGHYIIIFDWKADSPSNNKIEKKIISYIWKLLTDIRNKKEEKENNEKTENLIQTRNDFSFNKMTD